jgi:hypothetical protein
VVGALRSNGSTHRSANILGLGARSGVTSRSLRRTPGGPDPTSYESNPNKKEWRGPQDLNPYTSVFSLWNHPLEPERHRNSGPDLKQRVRTHG